MRNKKKQVTTPVKKVEAFTNKNSLICDVCGLHLEEGEDICGNGHKISQQYLISNSTTADFVRRSFFSNQL